MVSLPFGSHVVFMCVGSHVVLVHKHSRISFRKLLVSMAPRTFAKTHAMKAARAARAMKVAIKSAVRRPSSADGVPEDSHAIVPLNTPPALRKWFAGEASWKKEQMQSLNDWVKSTSKKGNTEMATLLSDCSSQAERIAFAHRLRMAKDTSEVEVSRLNKKTEQLKQKMV